MCISQAFVFKHPKKNTKQLLLPRRPNVNQLSSARAEVKIQMLHLFMPKLSIIYQNWGVAFLLVFAPPGLCVFCSLKPVSVCQREVRFWFATGGAGFCLSRRLAEKMIPWARYLLISTSVCFCSSFAPQAWVMVIILILRRTASGL